MYNLTDSLATLRRLDRQLDDERANRAQIERNLRVCPLADLGGWREELAACAARITRLEAETDAAWLAHRVDLREAAERRHAALRLALAGRW